LAFRSFVIVWCVTTHGEKILGDGVRATTREDGPGRTQKIVADGEFGLWGPEFPFISSFRDEACSRLNRVTGISRFPSQPGCVEYL
jgi:hypothetical protein